MARMPIPRRWARSALLSAKAAERAFARHIAEAPDRFRDQTPTPGSKDAVLRGIADLRAGTPNYERMSEALAAKVRSESPRMQSIFKEFGAVESIFFRGESPGGY